MVKLSAVAASKLRPTPPESAIPPPHDHRTSSLPSCNGVRLQASSRVARRTLLRCQDLATLTPKSDS